MNNQWGAPPAPPPAPRRNRTTRTVLIIVGAVLAVCCLGGVGGGFLLYRTVDGATAPARSAAVAYLDDLRAGNYPAAYGRLCNEWRGSVSQEEFTRDRSAEPKIKSYSVQGVNVSNSNGEVTATVTARITPETGAESTNTLALRKEDGDWRVCR